MWRDARRAGLPCVTEIGGAVFSIGISRTEQL